MLVKMGREEEASEWLKEVRADVDSLKPLAKGGVNKTSLLFAGRLLEMSAEGDVVRDEDPRVIRAIRESARYLEDYLQQEAVEPDDRESSKVVLAHLQAQIAQVKKQLEMLRSLGEAGELSEEVQEGIRELEEVLKDSGE